MVTTTRPASGGVGAVGALKALEGLRSSSMARSATRRCTTAITMPPLTAARLKLVCTSVSEATWPHSAAPAAVAPMMLIW